MIKKEITIGRATLILGDSEALRNAGRLPKIDALVSDPPYGIAFLHSGVGGGGGGLPASAVAGALANQERKPIVGDDKPFDFMPWLALCEKIAIMGADHYHGLPPGGTWCAWDKSIGIGPHIGFTDAEFAWVRGAKPRRNIYRHLWCGLMSDKSKERLPGGQAAKRVHVSQKPLGLMRWLIEHLKLRPGSLVLDPYMGSGSTGVAALQLGHRFIGVEIEERHFDTACLRIEEVSREGGLLR